MKTVLIIATVILVLNEINGFTYSRQMDRLTASLNPMQNLIRLLAGFSFWAVVIAGWIEVL